MSSSSCKSSSSCCSCSLLETELFSISSDVSDSVDLSVELLLLYSLLYWQQFGFGSTETGLVPTIASISLQNAQFCLLFPVFLLLSLTFLYFTSKIFTRSSSFSIHYSCLAGLILFHKCSCSLQHCQTRFVFVCLPKY